MLYDMYENPYDLLITDGLTAGDSSQIVLAPM